MNQLKTDLLAQIKDLLGTARHYYVIGFFILVGGLYIFLVTQINTYVNAQPDTSTIKADTAKKLRVDEDVANQLQNLRDNSVNVQAIPSTNRSNPFQE
jgi:hypothetical protein